MQPRLTGLILIAVAMVAAGVCQAKIRNPHAPASHKPSPNRPAAGMPTGNINVPSTDFSTIERSGEETEPRSRGGSMRPAIMDSGGIGLGTGF